MTDVVLIGPFAFAPKGTVSARAFPIARALAARGHRVTILMPPYDNLADSGRAWERDGVRLENMRISRNDLRHQLTVPALMAHRACRLGADVVHLFKPIGYGGLAGIALRLFSRRPLVLDADDWEGAGGWSDVNPYPALWVRLFAWQERWLARHAGAVTVASRTLQGLVWGLGVDPARVVYLPNGPDPALRGAAPPDAASIEAVRARLGAGEGPIVLYLGHIPRGTDLDLALEAWPQVCERLPAARLVIAGVGDGLEGLRERAEALGIAGRVLFPGWIDPQQAPLYLAAADAFVNPYRDTLVNRAKCAGKVVAAMAAGKAIVTGRLGENLEYLRDGQSGVLTEPGDAAGLARALVAVLSDREWARGLGEAARQRVWERFDWEARIGEVERAYALAMGRREIAAPLPGSQ